MAAGGLNGVLLRPASGASPTLLMILCHGIHADSEQLFPLVEAWRDLLPHAAFALPNAPLRRRRHWLGPLSPRRREWFPIHDSRPAVYERGAQKAAELLDPFIDNHLSRLGLAPSAYAMAGFSQGAMTVLHSGLRRPIAPRAIVSFAGALVGSVSLRREIKTRPPVMLIHGTQDRIVPASASRNAELVLRTLDVPVAASYVANLGHSLDKTLLYQSFPFIERNLTLS